MRGSALVNALPMLLLALPMATSGCGGRAPDPISLLPGGPTARGLRQVATDDTGVVFVRPGVRMGDYTELLVDPFLLSYTSGPDAGNEPVRMLAPEVEERFEQVVFEAFVDTMKYSRGFTLVDRPGPNALRVQGWLYELVLEEPLTDDPRHFPLCFAEVSILLTLRDSETARTLAEIGDRTLLTCPIQPEGYAVTSWKAVSGGVTSWAKRLRRWLEDLHALPPIEG